MADQWMIRGKEFGNCNCAFGCPCQFNSPSTHGHCQGIANVLIEEGNFNDMPLDGLCFVVILKWPGEVADGNGEQQVVIDEHANPDQREALRGHTKIDDLVESKGEPLINPFTGEEDRKRIHLPNGFEYTHAEMGAGHSKVTAAFELDLNNSYGQFNILHMNQDGVIR